MEISAIFGTFRMLTIKENSETEVFRHLSDHIFHSPYFGKYRSYDGHLFWKMFKIWCRFQKWSRKVRNIFSFLGNFIWIGYVKFSLLPREYLSLAVNVLTQSHKISGINKRNFFQLFVSHSNGKKRWKLHQADFSSVWDPLACWLLNSVLKRGFLDIYLTTFFAVHNFGNT